MAVQIDEPQRMRARRPIGIACASDSLIDVRSADGGLGEQGCAPLRRSAEEPKAVNHQSETHFGAPHVKRAHPAAVLQKTTGPVAADGFLVICTEHSE